MLKTLLTLQKGYIFNYNKYDKHIRFAHSPGQVPTSEPLVPTPPKDNSPGHILEANGNNG